MADTSTTTGILAGVPTELLISGTWRGSSDGGTFTKLNPSTEEPIAEVSAASNDDVDAAVRGSDTVRERRLGGASQRGAERS